ncbi:hypothetical protein LXL04_004214 [Taraxacum kok-saghyz]
MMMKMKDTTKSFKSLSQTIHSLLGFKNEIDSTWVNTVCDIIKSLPSTADYENDYDDSANGRDDDLDDFLIPQIHGELAALNEEVCRLNAQRRQILNQFLQLKGNIRVFCRIRPTINGEKFIHVRPVVPLDSSGILLNFAENKTKLYNFDKVFPPVSSQDEVFSEIEPVIKSALDGYNVCILAYGQTGTGKTFTMEGNEDFAGVVPRTIEALFKQAADSNHTYLFSFSMLEIYLGHLKDLLIPHSKKTSDPMPPCLSIQTDPNGGIVIDNLVAIQVSDFNHAISFISSEVNLGQLLPRIPIKLLVDLTGSERVLKTKAWGRRFEEGKAINLSLSALGDVINALQKKNSHIPYRNSKLTQVLKDSLGEDSKTLMLIHVSPKEDDLCETVCSLNFALRLRSIHLGKTESNEVKTMKELAMTDLQHEMQEIEDNRDSLMKEIKKLNQKLDFLTKTSSGLIEKSEIEDEIAKTPLSSKRPRFMKPTICSTRKLGTGHQNLHKKGIRHERRKKQLPLSRAESVSFPIKGMTESYSGSSISRASYMVDLNESEYSHETCSFKNSINKYKNSSKKSTNQSVHSSRNEDINVSKTKNNNNCVPQNKRVLSIPTHVRKSYGKEQMNKIDFKNTKEGKESRVDHSSPIPLTNIDYQIMPINDTYHQDDCVNQVDEIVSTQETRCLKAYEMKEVPTSDFDTSVKSSKVSFLGSEMKDYILILYLSVLLGLGFESLGFEDDFFRSLMS